MPHWTNRETVVLLVHLLSWEVTWPLLKCMTPRSCRLCKATLAKPEASVVFQAECLKWPLSAGPCVNWPPWEFTARISCPELPLLISHFHKPHEKRGTTWNVMFLHSLALKKDFYVQVNSHNISIKLVCCGGISGSFIKQSIYYCADTGSLSS